MKRVLNSGYIKLLSVEGSEQDLLKPLIEEFEESSLDEIITDILGIERVLEDYSTIEFKFEVKCPLLCLQTFQASDLGTLTTFLVQDTSEVYLPPLFYSQDPSLTFHPMVDKHCNELNTRFSNYYRNVLNFYNNLLKQGVCQSQAQLVLPQGLFTVINWQVTAKDLINLIEKNYNQSTEMFGYCGVFVLYLEECMPLITKWLKQNRWEDFKL